MSEDETSEAIAGVVAASTAFALLLEFDGQVESFDRRVAGSDEDDDDTLLHQRRYMIGSSSHGWLASWLG